MIEEGMDDWRVVEVMEEGLRRRRGKEGMDGEVFGERRRGWELRWDVSGGVGYLLDVGVSWSYGEV